MDTNMHEMTQAEFSRHLSHVRERIGRRRLERTTRDALRVRTERMRLRRLGRDRLAEGIDWKQELLDLKTERYIREIESRGGETSIEEERASVDLEVEDFRRDRTGRITMILLRAEGWRHYSNRFGARPAALAYLCGEDDSGPWAVRVPGRCLTVEDAVDAITPAAVCRAYESGRRVLRQGDVYVIERGKSARDDFSGLPESHHWDPVSRTLTHDEGHSPLHVPFAPALAVPQTALRMGRTSRRGRAD